MVIWIVVDRPWPCDHSFIEEVFARRLTHFAAVKIVIIFSGGECGRQRWHGVEIVASRWRHRSPQFVIDVIRIILSNKARPNLIVVRNNPEVAIACRLLLRSNVVIQLSHLKEEDVEISARSFGFLKKMAAIAIARISYLIRSYSLSISNAALPVSRTMLRMLRQRYRGPRCMTSVPLGAAHVKEIGVEHLATARKIMLDLTGQPTYICIYIGTLSRTRRLRILTDCICDKQLFGVSIGIVFIGNGNDADRADILDRASALGIVGRVAIINWIPRSVMYDYISAADAGLAYMPFGDHFEQNSPIKVMDYLSCGLPVVTTPQPESGALVLGVRGGLVSDDDSSSAFACALKALLAQKWDRKEIARKFFRLRSYDLGTPRLVAYLKRFISVVIWWPLFISHLLDFA